MESLVRSVNKDGGNVKVVIPRAHLRRVAVLAIVAAVPMCIVGCEAKENMRPGAVTVRASDVPERAQIIGRLGYPLGELLVLRGSWRWPIPVKDSDGKVINAKDAELEFRVGEIDGKPCNEDIAFKQSDVQRLTPTGRAPLPRSKDGDIWEIKGIETGGMRGVPSVVAMELWKGGTAPIQDPTIGKFFFSTTFVCISCTPVGLKGGEEEKLPCGNRWIVTERAR